MLNQNVVFHLYFSTATFHSVSFVVCKMLIGTDMCILNAILTVHFEQKIVKYNNGSAQVAVSNIY